MSNFNVASVKQILLASLDLPNTSQQSILISCMDASAYCDKSFSRKEYYEIHVKRCSSKTKENLKFDCDQCEKTFDNKRLLARHKRKIHMWNLPWNFLIAAYIRKSYQTSTCKKSREILQILQEIICQCSKFKETHAKCTVINRLERNLTMTLNKSTRYWQVLREYENKIYNGVK